MTKGVNIIAFVPKSSLLHSLLYRVLYAPAMHTLAFGLSFKQISNRTVLAKIIPQRSKCIVRQQRVAVFFAFALHYFNAHVLTVYISDFYVAAFFQPYATTVKQLYNCFLFNAACVA